MTIIIFLFFISCNGTGKLFSTLETSENENYGYSKENPILIGEYNHWQKNTKLTYYYLSKLSYNGNPLKMIMHATVAKPSNQPRKRESIPLRYGTPSSLGGKFLDLYVVIPKGTTDTLNLYFDVEIKGTIEIPKELVFDINQVNDIYSDN